MGDYEFDRRGGADFLEHLRGDDYWAAILDSLQEQESESRAKARGED